VFGRCDVGVVVGDLAVDAAVVEPVDVAECGELDVVETAPRSLRVDQFPLEQAVEGLGHGVVVGVADGADRRDDVVLGEAFGVAHAEILHALSE